MRRIPGRWWKAATENHQFRQPARIRAKYFNMLVSVTNVDLPEEGGKLDTFCLFQVLEQ